MSFRPHTADHVKVMNVDVHKHPKQPAQDLLADLLEVLRKGDSYEQKNTSVTRVSQHSKMLGFGANHSHTYSCRKDVFVVNK